MKCAIILFSMFCGLTTALYSVDFDKEILPILKTRCGKCHMDGESKGKVALDKHLISKEIGEGSIIPGNVKKSDLHWTMTLDPDDDLAMPPKGQRVPKEEIDLIAKWIEEGAEIGSMEAAPDPSMSGEGMNGGEMTGGPPAKKPYKGIFKNNSGMQVPATLTRIDGDRAILKLPDGKEYRYPIAMFAPDTQKIVKQFEEGTLPSSE